MPTNEEEKLISPILDHFSLKPTSNSHDATLLECIYFVLTVSETIDLIQPYYDFQWLIMLNSSLNEFNVINYLIIKSSISSIPQYLYSIKNWVDVHFCRNQ